MRVTDNTSRNAVHDALGRNRAKIEDLQLKNATLKRINAPSDDPVATSKIMDIRTQTKVNTQLEANAQTAKDRLNHTEAAVQELSEILMRAKEIALGQASGPSATQDSRQGVAQEVGQLYKQIVSISNRRVGENYLFGGFKTLTQPYSPDGKFLGDRGEIPLEIQKGVMININIPGPDIFQARKYNPEQLPEAMLEQDQPQEMKTNVSNRIPASEGGPKPVQALETVDVFKTIETLRVGLLTNDTHTIQGTIDAIDTILQNSITTRSKIGSRIMGIDAAITSSDRANVQNLATTSALEDADYAELWSSLAKEETVMRASMQAAQKLIQPSLLDFMR